MSTPNASLTVATASIGGVVASHNKNSLNYEVVMIADDSGHLQQTLPTYTWWTSGSIVGANKLHADLYNAAGSGKTLEIRGIWAIPKSDVAVTGVVGVEIGLYRTSAVGTGGTAATYNGGTTSGTSVITPWDSTNATLPAQITARTVPTGGATISALWWAQYIFTEETNAATYQCAMTNLLPIGAMTQRITLNPGEGILYKQGSVVGVGSFSFLTLFTLV